MRRTKPLPKESSFKEFSENRVKRKPSVRRGKSLDDKKINRLKKQMGEKPSGRESRGQDTRRREEKKDFRDNDRRAKPLDRKPISKNSRKEGSFRDRKVNDKHDRRESRGKSFRDDRRERGARGEKKVEMFDAVCMKCKKPCRVPFKPTRGKPVSCSDCFVTKGQSRRPNDRRINRLDGSKKFAKTNSGVRELFDAVCMKCGNKCKVPFKPTGKMGVSCSNCFDKGNSPIRKSGGDRKGKKSFDRNSSKPRGDRSKSRRY